MFTSLSEAEKRELAARLHNAMHQLQTADGSDAFVESANAAAAEAHLLRAEIGRAA